MAKKYVVYSSFNGHRNGAVIELDDKLAANLLDAGYVGELKKVEPQEAAAGNTPPPPSDDDAKGDGEGDNAKGDDAKAKAKAKAASAAAAKNR